MKNNSKYWIVTDLDGTLMDEDYDITPAKKTLKILAVSRAWSSSVVVFRMG